MARNIQSGSVIIERPSLDEINRLSKKFLIYNSNRALVAYSEKRDILGYIELSSETIKPEFKFIISAVILNIQVFNSPDPLRVTKELLLGVFSTLHYSDFAIPVLDSRLNSLSEVIKYECEVIKDYKIFHNPNRTYYTYKITASDSNKYYYGVRGIAISNASEQDCLDDIYMGSGGDDNNKFNNWKLKHSSSLKKEIMGIFQKKYKAYEHEKQLVSDLYKTDAKCLNSVRGGILSHAPLPRVSFKICPDHGDVKHIGDKCYLCRKKIFSIKICPLHGETIFRGEYCEKCEHDDLVSIKECLVHGLVKHRGKTCYNCINGNSISIRDCSKHGETKHIGDKCCKCRSNVTYKECKEHGLTLFNSDLSCYTCESQKNIFIRNCEIHGLVKHRGKTCYKCVGIKISHSKHLKKLEYDKNCKLCSL